MSAPFTNTRRAPGGSLEKLPPNTKTTLFVLSTVTLVMSVTNSMVLLYPAQALVQRWGAKQATSALSLATATAAALEIAGAGVVSRWLRQSKRNRAALLLCTSVPTCMNAVLSVLLSRDALPAVAIVFARGLGILAMASFLLATQTMVVTDPFLSQNPGNKAAAMGTQMGVGGIGFLVGMVLAGKFVDPPLLFRVASSAGFCVIAFVVLAFPKTPPSREAATAVDTGTPRSRRWRPSPQTLLFMLLTLPIFMGDFFLVFVKSQWNLDPSELSSLMVLFGVTNSVANLVVGRVLPRMGVRYFTALAIAGRLVQTFATVNYGYRGTLISMVLLFWSSAQNLGLLTTMDVQERTRGRSLLSVSVPYSLNASATATALLKIVGPCLYSALYIQGQAWWNQSYLPFYFNMLLSTAALIMTFLYL